ncbi:hypothetical protein M104_1395 [Bacteroides fragilis str. 1007-1-F |uniref:Uncharacterized protein n=3 Tax=Bacteroides fragilis TaxID=817 RepID=A0A015XGE0_BACFG|nr:hypothetical protein M101_1110 [Bacteroides fragilis str. 1007-1-F \
MNNSNNINVMFHSVFSPATGKCCFTPLGDSLQIYPNLSDKTNKL